MRISIHVEVEEQMFKESESRLYYLKNQWCFAGMEVGGVFRELIINGLQTKKGPKWKYAYRDMDTGKIIDGLGTHDTAEEARIMMLKQLNESTGKDR